jgi:HSP20 family protein
MNTLTQAQAAPARTADSAQANSRPQPALQPPVDVIEDANGITLYADMPGVPRDRLQLRVEGDQLTLEGDIALAVSEGTAAQHAEVTLPRYRRAFTLSKELDATQVNAELTQGVLRVRIPKAAHAQPRRIEVQVR